MLEATLGDDYDEFAATTSSLTTIGAEKMGLCPRIGFAVLHFE